MATTLNKYHDYNCVSRLLSEVEDVLGDRKEVTGDDLDKMTYTEKVITKILTSNYYF